MERSRGTPPPREDDDSMTTAHEVRTPRAEDTGQAEPRAVDIFSREPRSGFRGEPFLIVPTPPLERLSRHDLSAHVSPEKNDESSDAAAESSTEF